MSLNPRRITRTALLLLALLAIAAAVDGVRLGQQQSLNAAIRSGTLPEAVDGAAPQIRFAAAHAQAAAGADEAALDRYRQLQGDTPLGQAARYNSANLLMRQALQVRQTQMPGQAIPLIELAKETYREILRLDPQHWDARYNLERAQRLLPDPDEADSDPPELPRASERAATTMRGYSPGLP
jgi:mxaK protein